MSRYQLPEAEDPWHSSRPDHAAESSACEADRCSYLRSERQSCLFSKQSESEGDAHKGLKGCGYVKSEGVNERAGGVVLIECPT